MCGFYFEIQRRTERVEPILELDLCIDESEVDDYFDTHDSAKTLSERIQFLQDYMKVIGTTPFGKFTEAEKYSITKEVFVAGRWRSLTRKT